MRALRLALIVFAGSFAVAGVANAAQKISITPNPVDCGGGAPMIAKGPFPIIIANTGDAALTVQKPTIGGANPVAFVPDFGIYVNAFPLVLNPGTSIEINVTFTPTMVQNYSATLNVTSTDPNTPNSVIPMTGKGGYPQIAFDTKTLIFGNQRVMVPSAPGVFTVTDPGAGDLIISAIVLGGANPGDFTVTPAPPITIKPGANTKLNVVFKPIALGGRSASITVTSNGNNGMQQMDVLQVIGSGTQANVMCSPNMIDFGDSKVFQASAPKVATATNTAVQMADSFYITKLSFSGANMGDFALSAPPNLPLKVLPNNGTANINVVAVPLGLGSRMAKLEIETDNNMNCSIPLTANGVGASIQIMPPFADFGGSPVLADSVAKTITVTNKGGIDLNITDFEVLGPDAVVFNVPDAPKPLPTIMAPLKVAPNANFTFNVVFHPVVVMQHTAWVELHTDDPMAKLIKIPLSGIGAMAGFDVSTTTIDFGQIPVNTVAGPKSFNINNTGGSALNIKSITLGGGNPGAFMLDQTGPFPLDPGKMQAVNVTFSPLAAGTITADATIAVEGLMMTKKVNLRGVALAPSLGVSPPAIDFGKVTKGTMSTPTVVGLKNGGGIPISIASITSSDPVFTIDMGATKADLAPMAQTTFAVVFNPTAEGAKSGSISITLKGQNTPIQTITATGEGTAGGRMNKSGCGVAGTSGSAWPLGLLLLAGLLGASLLRAPRLLRARRGR